MPNIPANKRKRRAPVRRRVNVAAAVRAMRRAPLARVRARPVIRGRGVSSASINALRRFVFFPKKIKSDGTLDTQWWIEGLKWVGVIAMKILTYALSAEALSDHLTRYPLPQHHQLTGKLLAGSIPCGSIIRLMFGPEDFLGETDFVDTNFNPARGHYRQARLEWVKIIINPVATETSRGGMIAAVIIPSNANQQKDDFGVRLTEVHDFSELLKTPGVVYKTATTPTTLAYSPRQGEHAYEWLQFGCQDVKTGLYGAGGDCCLYLDVGYSDLSSDTNNQTSKYNLASSMFDVTVEARVHLREYDEGVSVRTGPIPLTNSGTLGVSDGFKTRPVPISAVLAHHGVLLHEDPISLEEMSI